MTATIHPLANVERGAELGRSVTIGPFCHVGANVVIGDRTQVFPRATIIGHTKIGADCEIHPHAVIGGGPQTIGYTPDETSRLEIGDRTVFRENASAHTGSPSHSGVTRIGSDCYFMTNVHIGHDCQIGDHCVIASGAGLAGHVSLGDHVWVGGYSATHQFTRVGAHAFIGGGAILVGDVIPYGAVVGNRAALTGLNVKGLLRRGFSRTRIRAMRRAYVALFTGEQPFVERVASAKAEFAGDEDVMQIIAFIEMDRPRPLCFPDRP
ncbi:MAG: acyl-ACP--UDP-N-acetylglucosamine O-acyltransferase [Pseudomonadota bacterium]